MTRYGIVFDLDDTLYPESEFVRSGFRFLAGRIHEKFGYDLAQVESFLWDKFQEGEPSLDRLLSEFPNIAQVYSVADLIELYRFHKPDIQFYPGIRELLAELKTKVFLGVISDGWYKAQSNKQQALELNLFFNKITLTDVWGRDFWKPHPRAFEEMERITFCDTWVYIGDNPKKDFIQPNGRNWKSIRLRIPEQIHFNEELLDKDQNTTLEVDSVLTLWDTLRLWKVI